MGTRAVYTFKDEFGDYHVYKHWDNYPKGAAGFIEKALSNAWELPRFEATDFGAAFISANKTKGGDLRLSLGDDSGLDYKYTIYQKDNQLYVTCYEDKNFNDIWEVIFDGPFEQFKEFARG